MTKANPKSKRKATAEPSLDDVINTTAARLAGIELPDMPVGYRVPFAVVSAVLKVREDVVRDIKAGAEPSGPPPPVIAKATQD